MSIPKYVLTISGSDSSGGAGMQADNRAILAAGAFPLNVLTAVTLQTPSGVEAVELMSPEFVKRQARRLLETYPVAAIKSGMLGSSEIALALADLLDDFAEVSYVLDPVLVSTSGHRLLDVSGVDILRDRLMHRATLTTPNLDELYALSGATGSELSMDLALALVERVGQAVLLKGGHVLGEHCDDWLLSRDGSRELLSCKRVESKNLRGTGCAFSAAIAAQLALGHELSQAVHIAKQILGEALQRQAGIPWIGSGPAFV